MTQRKLSLVAQTLDKYHEGSHITDAELKETIEYLQKTVHILIQLGPRFDTDVAYLSQVLGSLRTSQLFRKISK